MAISEDLIIIGDRILIEPDTDKEKTDSGLYLPQGVATKEKIQTGYIVKAGPGYIVPYHTESGEPWNDVDNEPRYIPLQVAPGDYAIFLRKEAIEIEYSGKKYLIVPQAGVLAVQRNTNIPRREL